MRPATSRLQDNFIDIQFTALLKRVGAYELSGYKAYQLQKDPRFFLFVQVTSAEPEIHWFPPGQTLHLLVQDAAQLLGENPQESVGKRLRFVVRTAKVLTDEMVAEGEGRFQLISVTPEPVEQNTARAK